MEDAKKLAINVMIGSIAGAAAIAVIAVLIGEFSEALERALYTLGMVALHSLVAISYMQSRNDRLRIGSSGIFSNTVFGVIVLSFFTSIFAVWGIFPGEFTARLYGLYFVFMFAALHGEALQQTTGKEKRIDSLVVANYIFMAIVIVLLMPIILIEGVELGDLYYRILAACGIIDATLTILAVVLHRLYLQQHPEENSTLFASTDTYDANGNPVQVQVTERPRRIHPLIVLLGIYLFFQFIGSFFFAIFR